MSTPLSTPPGTPLSTEADLDLLLDPTAAVPTPSAATLAAGHAVLDAALDRAHAALTVRHRRRRYAALAGLAAAAVGVAVVAPTLAAPGHRPAADAAAAEVLTAAGRAAGAQSGGWPAAAYWRSSSTYSRGGETFHRTIWVAHRGTGSLVDPGVDPGVIPLETGDFTLGLSWDQLYALPTDPTRLAQVLRRMDVGHGRNPDRELFAVVDGLLAETPASPQLRRALYQVAAAVPGVHADGAVVDRTGRTGQGVSRDGNQIVVAAATGQLLQYSEPGGWVATYTAQGPAVTAPTPSYPLPTSPSGSGG